MENKSILLFIFFLILVVLVSVFWGLKSDPKKKYELPSGETPLF